jgi:hypothetical protein
MQFATKTALTWMCVLICLTSLAPAAANQVNHIAALPAAAGQHIRLSVTGESRGYLTTPQELAAIAQKAAQGIEPYQSAVNDVLAWADHQWDYPLAAEEHCPSADAPAWNDNDQGTPRLYARALAYHLTADQRYAQQASAILERIMSEVLSISLEQQQCELLQRRGDATCYNNVVNQDLKNFRFTDPKGKRQTVTLYAGRGSIERAIQAIIIDSQTEWRHDSALEVAYRYYAQRPTRPGSQLWFAHIQQPTNCTQDICFGTLTHGFAPGESLSAPTGVRPPR